MSCKAKCQLTPYSPDKKVHAIFFKNKKPVVPITEAVDCSKRFTLSQGRNRGWKVEGDQGLGPNTGAQGRAGCWVREGVAPSRCEGPVENLDAKSCILVTVAVKFLAFENYGQEVWGTNTLLVPQPKSWGTSLPRFLRLLRLCIKSGIRSVLWCYLEFRHSSRTGKDNPTDCLNFTLSHLWPTIITKFWLNSRTGYFLWGTLLTDKRTKNGAVKRGVPQQITVGRD